MYCLHVLLVSLIQDAPHGALPTAGAVIARMQAWESRFEAVRIGYTSSGLSGSKFELQTLPGSEGLAKNGIPVWSYVNGVCTSILDPAPHRKLIVYYGSVLAMDVSSTVATNRTILFSLGIYGEGSLRLSELVALDPSRSIAREGRKGLIVRFSSQTDRALTYFVRWRDEGDCPYETGIARPDMQLSHRFSWSPGEAWPLHVTESAEHGSQHRQSTCIVSRPKPLSTSMPLLSAVDGDLVLDESYNVEHVQGDDGHLNEFSANEALEAARASRSQKVKTKPGLLCGPQCLYYLSRLVGNSATEESILNALPEASVRGSSFFELKTAASKLGLDLEGYSLTIDQLIRLNKPAILAVRTAHFVLFVPGSHPLTVLDPPYTVRVANAQELSVLWTGQALMEKQ